jgi:hypothetical protein
MNANYLDRLRKIYDRASTPTLANALRILEVKSELDQHERKARAWIIDELERRCPEASAAVAKAFDEAAAKEEKTGEYVGVDYVTVLLANIKA